MRLASENALIRTLRANDKKMYEITKDTIEAINIKCHDLKHRIYAMQKFPGEETEELKNLLRIYDSNICTGNDVVDVVLMDYALRYDRAGVRFSFHGDGSELSFLSEVEIASLFGNAVSNAAEAAVKLKDPEKRLVDLRLERTGGLLTFTARNYIEEAPLVREGYFVSSKGEDGREHGFGLRSMEQIAKKYGGGVRVLTEEDIFILSVFMLVK